MGMYHSHVSSPSARLTREEMINERANLYNNIVFSQDAFFWIDKKLGWSTHRVSLYSDRVIRMRSNFGYCHHVSLDDYQNKEVFVQRNSIDTEPIDALLEICERHWERVITLKGVMNKEVLRFHFCMKTDDSFREFAEALSFTLKLAVPMPPQMFPAKSQGPQQDKTKY